MEDRTQIAKDWSEVNLQKGKDLLSLNVTGLTNQEYITTAYDILTGKDDFKSLSGSEMVLVKDQVQSLLNSPIPDKMKYEFVIDGRDFYLQYDLTSSSWGQFIDMERILESSENNIWLNVHQLLACLIREKAKAEAKPTKFKLFKTKRGKRIKEVEEGLLNKIILEDYDSNKRIENANLFLKHLSIADVYSIVFFFIKVGLKYINNLTAYSIQKDNPLMQSNNKAIGNSSTKVILG